MGSCEALRLYETAHAPADSRQPSGSEPAEERRSQVTALNPKHLPWLGALEAFRWSALESLRQGSLEALLEEPETQEQAR